MAARPRECPCYSGQRYTDCCKPRHDGSKLAETPEALMRSRYSAFALGLGRYLVDTMARTGEDLALPADDLVRELGRVKDTQRFMGLRIIHSAEDGDRGEVMFFARVFERGSDRSFVELSRFVREDGRWKYVDGELVAKDDLPKDPSTITREEVDAVLAAVRRAAAANPAKSASS